MGRAMGSSLLRQAPRSKHRPCSYWGPCPALISPLLSPHRGFPFLTSHKPRLSPPKSKSVPPSQPTHIRHQSPAQLCGSTTVHRCKVALWRGGEDPGRRTHPLRLTDPPSCDIVGDRSVIVISQMRQSGNLPETSGWFVAEPSPQIRVLKAWPHTCPLLHCHLYVTSGIRVAQWLKL